MKKLALVALLLSSTAYAQEPTVAPDASKPQSGVSTQPTPQTSPAAPVAPQKLYFEVDPSDVQAISQALNELPKRVADPLILKLNAQLQVQAKIMADRAKAMEPPKAKVVDKDEPEPRRHHYRRHTQ